VRPISLAVCVRIGFMDGDEFFVTEDLRGTIPALLARFEEEDVAAVAFNRLVRY
jgi:hypothetical protein